MTRRSYRVCSRGAVFLIVVAAAVVTLAGCSPVVEDRFVENQGAEAFLDRIAKSCGTLSVGNQQLKYLLDESNNDTFFVDETSKLYFGRVDKSTYSSDINAFFPTDTNQPAFDCIFQQLQD